MKSPQLMQPFLLTLASSTMLVFASCGGGSEASVDEAGVKKVLQQYFDSWSARDMEKCGQCFDDNARICLLENGQLKDQGKMDFIHEQTMLHLQSSAPMKEVANQFRVQGDDKVAQAAVTWVLTIGDRKITGTDFFTLRRDNSSWKIINLTFYGS
jgi:hypothetical protein